MSAGTRGRVLENDDAWSVIEPAPAPELSALVGVTSSEDDA
jgi:hypothetical protein